MDSGHRRYIEEHLLKALNYNRPKFQKMWDLILSNQVEGIIIAYKDRFARFGYDFFETMCKRFNMEIVIMNKAEEKTYAFLIYTKYKKFLLIP
ncbi:hypothetical protein [Clostridium kluyveri]|uniref:Resolvase/invertase-type recombinase catalytic domain-containing protein n=1 Tax=Clostridium kluyveri TaxID=1534 RepID=A0A1L5F4S4_CLOKL|nr:hypothetical protein [Clostridium kluyveri]APM37952.1 hypothetical protein BS101_03985 [Clostridium kluyveri]UZQ52041.1 hypothetical protein OP486_07740 [Clostridium kluyveri]